MVEVGRVGQFSGRLEERAVRKISNIIYVYIYIAYHFATEKNREAEVTYLVGGN